MADRPESVLGALGGTSTSRRTMLKSALGVAGLATAGPLLAACGGDSGSGSSSSAAASGGESSSAAASGTVTFGSNASDEVPRTAYEEVFKKFTAASGIDVAVNTVDHNTFQEQINSYLQGSPDQDFTWFAGYRMRFFAEQGLAQEINSVWENIGGDFNESFKQASTGNDGNQYFVPFYYYPWALFYRKSVFKELGIDPESITTLDELNKAAATMKDKGLTPLAFADKDGWPAMGTFDYGGFKVVTQHRGLLRLGTVAG